VNKQGLLNGSLNTPEAADKNGLRVGSRATRRREGFERWHVQEKLQFYNVAGGPSAEVRSLLYVIQDNYPVVSAEAGELREKSVSTGKVVTGLIQSTESRKTKPAGILSSVLLLLVPC
jgi:hypothetical protein